MDILDLLSVIVIFLTASYLVVFGAACLVRPEGAKRFLEGFAASAKAHYFEMTIRLIVGLAFVRYAPHISQRPIFTVVGAMIIVTTAVLLLIPWRWHQRFAKRSVAQAIRYLTWIGIASVAFGTIIMWSALPA